jgi:hypothetical protein
MFRRLLTDALPSLNVAERRLGLTHINDDCWCML